MSLSTTETLVRGYIHPDENGCVPGSTIHIPDWSEHMKARIAKARTKHEKERLSKILNTTPALVQRFWKLWRNGEEPDSEAVEAVRQLGAWKQAQSYQPKWTIETIRLVLDEVYRGTRPTNLAHTWNTKS